ncbi:MAG: methionine--tRNA ligase [Bacteroidia bacterium]
MTNPTRYTITAALPYANGPIHIGHLAGAYLPADIYVRYLRSQGREVAFICGSDEHGVAIELKAKKEGVTPRAIVDKYHAMIRNSFQEFGISFDVYSRTSTELHKKTASDFFLNLHEKGIFEKKITSQFYDRENNQFLPDRYITGTCPVCGNESAYGDQCEKCGSSLDPADLINSRSVISGNVPELKETAHWYLPLDKYQDWVQEWLETHPGWKSNVLGQCRSWLKEGLHPRSITRDLSWGVPVPLQDAEGKVLYVWFDAPIGYISATKEFASGMGKSWEPYWKNEDTRLIHFIGKDNIIFHCIIFPIMLHLHGDYILPKNVPANEFLNLEGQKISTSRNWAVWLHEYLQDFPGKEDVLRYHLTSIMPENKDNDFTWKDFQAKNNNELVAILGNLVNRMVVLTDKYFAGKAPQRGTLTEAETALQAELSNYPGRIAASLEKFRFREALNEYMNLARLANKYLTDHEPWKLIKTDEARTKTILNTGLQVVANLAILGAPFLPHTAEKIKTLLNLGEFFWKDAGSLDLVIEGQQITKGELIFEKIDDAAIEKQMEKLNRQNQATNQAVPERTVPGAREEIQFDDFMKLDLRVGKILKAEKIEKADKLLKLLVDVGFEERTIVSGIAQHFKPEEIEGLPVSVVVNLTPKSLRGVESKGMILMAENEEGKLSFISPGNEQLPGSIIR